MLFLILAESALEPVPRKFHSDPIIRRLARRKGKKPSALILDSSLYPQLIRRLPMSEKRGRPDIVHISLLCALGTPLNMEGLLRVFVHTIQDKVIEVNPEVRLPRNYNRFIGLIEQLYEHGQVPPSSPPLLTLKEKTLAELMKELNPEKIILFSEGGKPVKLDDYMAQQPLGRIATIVGGFPHGSFSESTLLLADEQVSIHHRVLDAWTVVSRIIYCYELALSCKNK
ncbi:MAG: 16S rRNA methyltransferase [Candidatus Freyarchaeota archaeon]|nr:hypothetical protein [Candidatus Freyrarchaeum guaymaensis]